MKILYATFLLSMTALIAGCGQKTFTIPKPIFEITTVGIDDSLKYIVTPTMPGTTEERLMCKTVELDTLVIEWQRFNPVLGDFESFRTYTEGIQYSEFIEGMTNKNELLSEIAELQEVYNAEREVLRIERERIAAEETRWDRYREKLEAEEIKNIPAIKATLNSLLNNGHYINQRGPANYLSNLAFEFEEPTGELRTYKGKNVLGANYEYTYYVKDGQEIRHGQYRSWQEYKNYSTPYTFSMGTIWIDGEASLECEYRNGKVHGRLYYHCDAMIEWSRGLDAEHVKEDKVFYIYKDIIDGDGIQIPGRYSDYTINSLMGIIRSGEIRDKMDRSITEIKPTMKTENIDTFLSSTPSYDFNALTLQAPYIYLPYIME